MFDLTKNMIVVNRGDSFQISLFINSGTELSPTQYVLQNDDIVYLGVFEPREPFENSLIRKVYTKDNLSSEGNLIIKFDVGDTLNLLPGTYYYEIKLSRKDENNKEIVDTIIQRQKFVILN